MSPASVSTQGAASASPVPTMADAVQTEVKVAAATAYIPPNVASAARLRRARCAVSRVTLLRA
jgi:hypothetical protein